MTVLPINYHQRFDVYPFIPPACHSSHIPDLAFHSLSPAAFSAVSCSAVFSSEAFGEVFQVAL